MSTPPFVDAPEGVAVVRAPQSPLPAMIATPVPGREVRGRALLVPGFTGSKEDFIAVLRPLADLGWEVAAIDLPGQNGSPALGGRGVNTVPALATAVAAALDWLGQGGPVHLVGHSAGGLVTREVILSEPGTIATWTALCTGPGPLPEQSWPQLQALLGMLDALPMPQVWRALDAAQRSAAPAGRPPVPAPVAAFLKKRFLGNDPAALADLGQALMGTPDRTDEVARLLTQPGAPVITVVTGSEDDAWPVPQQKAMAEALGVPWHLMHGVGHSPAAQAPLATARVLDAIWSGTQSGRPGTAGSGAGPAAAAGPGPLDPAGSADSPSGAAEVGANVGRTGVTSLTAGYKAAMAFHATLACDRLAPRAARRAISDFLSANNLDGVTDDAALLTSELVTNAVRHASGPIHVDAYLRAQQLRLEVADDAADAGPAPRRADPDDENGRGMELVEKLAVKWGWHTIGHRKTVWLELAL